MARYTDQPDRRTPSGVVVKFFGDPLFDIELDRAPDSGGSPGTWVNLIRLPAGTPNYTDQLPKTGTGYWYRARHVADGYDPGAYTTAVSTKATEMPLGITDESVVSLNLPTPIAASLGGTGQSSYAIGDLLYASAQFTLSRLTAVASGRVLASAGVATPPVWTDAPTLTRTIYNQSAAAIAIQVTQPSGSLASAISISGGTDTGGANPIIDVAQTWNATGVTFTGIRLNVAITAAGALSKLLDLQVGGGSQFSVRRDGFWTSFGGGTITQGGLFINAGGLSVDGDVVLNDPTNDGIWSVQGTTTAVGYGFTSRNTGFIGTGMTVSVVVSNATLLTWSAGQQELLGNLKLEGAGRVINFDDDNAVIQRVGVTKLTLANGSVTFADPLTKTTFTPVANTQAVVVSGYSLTGASADAMLDLAGTWNTTGAPTAILVNITNTASGAASKFLDFRLSAVAKFTVDKNGALTMAGALTVAGAATFNGTATFNSTVTLNQQAVFSAGSAAAPGLYISGTLAGLYGDGTEMVGIAANGAASAKFDNSTTADEMRCLLWDVSAAAFKRVKRGGANTGPGGSGRALFIDN